MDSNLINPDFLEFIQHLEGDAFIGILETLEHMYELVMGDENPDITSQESICRDSDNGCPLPQNEQSSQDGSEGNRDKRDKRPRPAVRTHATARSSSAAGQTSPLEEVAPRRSSNALHSNSSQNQHPAEQQISQTLRNAQPVHALTTQRSGSVRTSTITYPRTWLDIAGANNTYGERFNDDSMRDVNRGTSTSGRNTRPRTRSSTERPSTAWSSTISELERGYVSQNQIENAPQNSRRTQPTSSTETSQPQSPTRGPILHSSSSRHGSSYARDNQLNASATRASTPEGSPRERRPLPPGINTRTRLPSGLEIPARSSSLRTLPPTVTAPSAASLTATAPVRTLYSYEYPPSTHQTQPESVNRASFGDHMANLGGPDLSEIHNANSDPSRPQGLNMTPSPPYFPPQILPGGFDASGRNVSQGPSSWTEVFRNADPFLHQTALHSHECPPVSPSRLASATRAATESLMWPLENILNRISPRSVLLAASTPTNRATNASASSSQTCLKRHAKRRNIEERCPVCYEAMDTGLLETIRWCKNTCGQNLHRECLESWHQIQQARVGRPDMKTCPMCRDWWHGPCSHDD